MSAETNDIRHIMERFGRRVTLHLPDETSSGPFGAFVQPLRYKNKMYLGGVNTRIGFNREGHYLYLGPPEHDLTTLPRGAWIAHGEERYTIDRAEVVFFGDEPGPSGHPPRGGGQATGCAMLNRHRARKEPGSRRKQPKKRPLSRPPL